MNACTTCAVRERAICQSLQGTDLEELSHLGRRHTVAPGETVMWQGDEDTVVGNVIDGVLKLTASTADGREQTLGIAYPSDFIGRPFGRTTSHSVVALSDAKVCTFPRSAFDRFAAEHPDLEHKLLQRTLTELDRSRHWMVLLGRKSAAERLAAFLLDMTDRLGAEDEAGHIRFNLPFGRQDIADLLGLTIETVSRQITKLRDEGVIATPDRRGIVVLDREWLTDCAGE
jgi:CRP/FNR family transcriptional regulator, anaerobic regulatory protein